MATVRKLVNKHGLAWMADFYDPSGKRVRKCFALRKDAEAFVGKAVSARREGRYEDFFKVKQEKKITFNELADRYEENFQHQRCFSRLKRYYLVELRKAFGDKVLSQISYLEIETHRNRRKAEPTRAGKPRSDATVNREMSLLRHLLNKAVEGQFLTESPFARGRGLFFKENN